MAHRILFAYVCTAIAVTAWTPVFGRSPQVPPPPGVGPVPVQQPQRDPNAQPAVRRIPVGTAVITGTVTAADTGRPLRGVRVTVNGNTGPLSSSLSSSLPSRTGGPGLTSAVGVSIAAGGSVGIVRGTAQGMSGGMGTLNASRTALTDAQGGFVIDHLPAGQYSVSASRNTFLQTNYGQKKPGGPGTTVLLIDGQKLTLNMQLLRGGVIAGTVFGEDGDPLAQTQVQAWRYTMNNGMKRLQGSNGTSTDDRGAYRLSGLQPGDYIVSATVYNSDAMMADRMLSDTALIAQAIAAGAIQAGAAPGLPSTVALPVNQSPQNRSIENSTPGFVPVFHPNTIEPRNATMVRVAGGDEHPFIDIQLQVAQASNVVGSVTNPPGQDLGVQVFLMNDDPFMESTKISRAEQNGQFAFRNVSPGKYTIQAEVIPSPQPTVVNGVSTQRVGPPPPLEDSQRWWGRDVVSVDGQGGVSPGRYQIRPPMSAKSAIIEGKDTLDFPFDFSGEADVTNAVLTVTDRQTEIAGALADATGKPRPDETVIIAATEDQYWTPGSRRIGFTRTRADGQYSFHNFPPGTYVLAVVTDLEYGMQYDVEFLKALAAAATTRVTLAEGEKLLRDLRVAR